MLLCPWDFSGKNTGVDCHALLQGIFLTQGLNTCLLYLLPWEANSRDLFKKIRDTKGTCHAKMGTIKDRNGMALTEAEDIKKRWQDYMEELNKKIFITQMITMV